jgi:hypothetical protein
MKTLSNQRPTVLHENKSESYSSLLNFYKEETGMFFGYRRKQYYCKTYWLWETEMVSISRLLVDLGTAESRWSYATQHNFQFHSTQLLFIKNISVLLIPYS